MIHKNKKCKSCQGKGVIISPIQNVNIKTECPSCEGTGVILFDEESDSMHNLYVDDDTYYKEEDE